ncbi:MAG: class I SAM-dependent methyltransferase [Bacteroidota bacterium]
MNSPKQIFDKVALLYNAVRPRYPEELFSALIDVAGLHQDAALLEIGPGTGQATKPLAEKGFQITAVESGYSLAEVAKMELKDYSNVQVINTSFEEADFLPASFDLVYAATSFHWIDHAVKFTKTYRLLRENGYLAVIDTNHISDEAGDKFFFDSQPVYERYNFLDNPRPQLPEKSALKPGEMDGRLFKLIHFQVFPVIITYPAKNFAGLLNTYSIHLQADEKIQQLFYQEIEDFINANFDGRIDKHFAMSLTIAQKR